ncbi:MAG TPA: hypothetical protein VFV37_07570, partial [Luteibaculaceae bacterium]|nr:hypothetical protein [Luteibaculaceae bacterium]
KPLGLAMIAPTVGVAVWLLARSWSDFEERMHNLAVCCWIAANSIWMTGEFFEVESARTLAAIAFGLGLCSIGRFYIAKILLWWRQREL